MHAFDARQPLLASSSTLACVDLSVIVGVEHTSGISLPLSPIHTTLVTQAHLLGGSRILAGGRCRCWWGLSERSEAMYGDAGLIVP